MRVQTIVRRLIIVSVLFASLTGAYAAAQTPEREMAGCDEAGTPMAGMDHGAMGHGEGTPGMEMEQVEFDLMYIDMMIPHHESIIALAQVAQGELTHPDLIEIAAAIVETQDAEIQEMELLRETWYPGAAPVSMEAMMGMPGMEGTDMTAMDQQMSAEWQVQTFCAAEDKDLAFIEQVIPHHQMAIEVSEAALEHAVHPELTAIAQRVIEDQQHEIEELETIRAELAGEATPAA